MDYETAKENEARDKGELTGAIRYDLLKSKNPAYYGSFWRRARALYRGGTFLLDDAQIMSEIFPRHAGEHSIVYDLRKKLASYSNVAGAIIGQLLSRLATDPIRCFVSGEMDSWYQDFLGDCSRPGGEKISLNRLVSSLVLTALQCKRAYALVDLPAPRAQGATLRVEQETAGDLDAFAVEVAPESVFDWEADSEGNLQYAVLGFCGRKRPSPFSPRNAITEKYWIYTASGWARYETQYREGEGPKDDDLILPAASGEHSFGRVPLVCLDLPEGLWAMNKLESLAREHLNKRNALSWAEYKALLPTLYEYLDEGKHPSLAGGPAADANRDVSQYRSPAHVQTRRAAPGGGDRAEYVAPPSAPFAHALQSCGKIADDMHAVTHSMAMSVDTDGARIKRSGLSKSKDEAALDTVLGELGKLARESVSKILELVETGRGDKPQKWIITGLDRFETKSTDSAIEAEATIDSTVSVPSPTFQIERKKQFVRVVMGDSVPEETLRQIDDELESAYSSEDFGVDREIG